MIADSVLPVFIVIAVGVLLDRIGMIVPPIRSGLNRIAYWVCLPALLFVKTTGVEFARAPLPLLGMLMGGMAAAIAASYVLGWGMRLPRVSLGALVHAAFRGNLAFIALPIILYAAHALPRAELARLESTVILVMVPTVIVYNLVSVLVLIAHGPHTDAHPLRRAATQLATNPLILSCVCGLAVRLLGWRLPLFAERTFDTLAGAAFPMALLAIGSQLARTRIGRHVGWAAASALIKVSVAPLAGYVVGRLLGLGAWELRAGLVLLAAPTAVASYVLTDQLGGDAELAAGAIVVSTLFSFASLSIVLLLPIPG